MFLEYVWGTLTKNIITNMLYKGNKGFNLTLLNCFVSQGFMEIN